MAKSKKQVLKKKGALKAGNALQTTPTLRKRISATSAAANQPIEPAVTDAPASTAQRATPQSGKRLAAAVTPSTTDDTSVQLIATDSNLVVATFIAGGSLADWAAVTGSRYYTDVAAMTRVTPGLLGNYLLTASFPDGLSCIPKP
jgi:hypothetical protein